MSYYEAEAEAEDFNGKVNKVAREALKAKKAEGGPRTPPGIFDVPQLKDTNPKDAVGVKKAPISTVSGAVMAEVGLGMLEGARKYGRHNYRESGVRASVYHDATWRHMLAWWDFGQDLDPDSGLSHVTKAIASLMVLRDAMMMDNWIDDRPPALPTELLERFNEKAVAIIEKYPNAKKPVTNESLKRSRNNV
jgi:hypothetical protein